MPRFSLRTLIVVMLLGGPLLACLWWGRQLILPVVVVVLVTTGPFFLAAGIDRVINQPPLPLGEEGENARPPIGIAMQVVLGLYIVLAIWGAIVIGSTM